jgi:hypothetical protein
VRTKGSTYRVAAERSCCSCCRVWSVDSKLKHTSLPLTMNVVQSRPVQSRTTEDASSGASKQAVNFYRDIPSYELSLDEFEEYALARLKVCCVLPLCVSCAQNGFSSHALSLGSPQTGRTQDPQRDGACLSSTNGRRPHQDGSRQGL